MYALSAKQFLFRTQGFIEAVGHQRQQIHAATVQAIAADRYPVALGGDRLLAVHPNRDDDPAGIHASISDDFGKSWNRDRDLIVFESGAGTEPGARKARSTKEKFDDMKTWRFGHPRGVLLTDGTVFVVFYAGDDIIKSARWARIDVNDI